jgi:hypothetical protein
MLFPSCQIHVTAKIIEGLPEAIPSYFRPTVGKPSRLGAKAIELHTSVRHIALLFLQDFLAVVTTVMGVNIMSYLDNFLKPYHLPLLID